MTLSQKELEGIIKGEWKIDCPSMNLIPACADIEGYQGVGYIEQAGEHNLRFKIISTQKTGPSFKPEPTQAGQLYAPEEFWRLVAKDIHGREWTSEHILPDVLHNEGTVATGNLQKLNSSTCGQTEEPYAIKLWLLGDFEVTCNQPKMTTVTVGGEEISSSGEWNHGKFSLGPKEFSFIKEKSWFFLESRDPERSFHPYYANRIEESLEFVLGRPARATVLLRNHREICSLEIRPEPPSPPDAHAKPPYRPPIKDKKGHFWSLFCLHLKYIEEHNSGTRCPLSRAWQHFTQSRSSALEIRALALGVGIEALMKIFYPRDSDPPLQIESARGVINAAADLEENIKSRLLGCLNSMKRMSPSDRLHKLVERGIIGNNHFEAWKRIRNRAAHAGDFSIDDATIRDCDLVLTAAHRIVFDIIGYKGAYKDYGTPGWPNRQ